MEQTLLEITIILGIASFLGVIAQFLRQPPLLGYILGGIVVGPLGIYQITNPEMLEAFSQIGVTLLLFTIGMELTFTEFRRIGRVALYVGLGQVLFTTLVGFILTLMLGFEFVPALYIATALAFSSTIIVIKLLSERKDTATLYGRISIGYLLVQDFVAVVVLMILSSFGQNGSFPDLMSFLFVIGRGAILLAGVFLASKTLIPWMIAKMSLSPETLFLVSIAWALGVAAFVSSPAVGFSIELGGFLAGITIANSSEHFQITSRIRPLRDFFVTIFFFFLGFSLSFSHIFVYMREALLLSVFVLIGNPLIILLIMGFMGFRKRTSFLVSVTAAQISEFSLILVFLGERIGHLKPEVVGLVSFVAVTTMTASTYLILSAHKLYSVVLPVLGFFERSDLHFEKIDGGENKKDHVVLVGCDRTGFSILEELQKQGYEVLVIDYNPKVVEKLQSMNVPTLFGDIGDVEIQTYANLDDAKLVISTVADLNDNLILLDRVKEVHPRTKVIVNALFIEEAQLLYKAGADYVIVPHFVSGEHVASLLKGERLQKLKELKEKDLLRLSAFLTS